MTTHFIVTVGTSIIGKHGKAYPSATLNPRRNQELPIPAPKTLFPSYRKTQFENCQGAEEKSIQKVLEKLFGPEQPEAGTLHFHLIATDTRKCRFCASYIGHELPELEGHKVTYYVPEHLGKASDPGFANKGVPSLLTTVAKILDGVEKKGGDAVIIPTGGYKAIIPYMTIAAILYKRPIYYIYEDSDALLELPAPPLGVETVAFRSALVLLENIQGETEASAAPYMEELPESYRSLVYLSETGQYEYNAFGRRLKTLFEAHPGSPLAIRVVGNTLIPRLGDLEGMFRKMTGLGETIWIGDKAPVMADHARYHHVNLLAYAELILSPLLRDQPDFLSEEELFLLLGMIYLHDCGHARGMIPDETGALVPLLPTEIRNFHNLLGYHRMTDPAFLESLARQGLDKDPDTLYNIATLALYHRKKMSLIQGEYTGPDGIPFKPLREQSIDQGGRRIRGDLLVALFRIIDGMDKQVGRAGDAVEISMRAESILADLEYLWSRIQRLEKMIAGASPEAKRKADDILSDIFEDYQAAEAAAGNAEDGPSPDDCLGCRINGCAFEVKSPAWNKREQAKYAQLQIDLSKSGIEDFLPLAWEYLDARVRFMFQALQPTYYYSDLLLKMPHVSHSSQDGIRRIAINFEENRDTEMTRRLLAVWEEIRRWITRNVDSETPNRLERNVLNAGLATPTAVVAGVRDEYCGKKYSEVAQILHEHGVIIQFQLNGNAVPCWRTTPSV